MLDKFVSDMALTHAVDKGDKILLAVSGGMDSVAMAYLFHQGGYNVVIAHCNFGLRGVESDADELFVNKLADSFKIPFHSTRFSTLEFAKQNGLSIQMAARRLRYEWFEEIRLRENCRYLATAHHRNDNTETILLNFIRGCGLAGLQGIKPVRGNIIRPLLGFTREEIEQWVKQQNISYREDASNAETKYIRNKIRHQIIPVCKEINPSFNNSIDSLSKVSEDALNLLSYFLQNEQSQLVSRRGDEVIISIAHLKTLPGVAYVLYELLREYNFPAATLNEIASGLDSQPGKCFYSPSHVCLKDRNELIISPLDSPEAQEIVLLTINECTVDIPEGKLVFTIRDVPDILKTNNPDMAMFDLAKIHLPLVLRHPQEGDFFYPFGMKGKKKINDFLTDNKIPLTYKHRTWLLCSNGDIIWIAGMRPDERYKVDKNTQKVLEVNFIRENQGYL